MKFITFLSVFTLFQVFFSFNARCAYIVNGNVESLSDEQKLKVYEVITEPFKTSEQIKVSLKGISSDLEVKYVPDTLFQIRQLIYYINDKNKSNVLKIADAGKVVAVHNKERVSDFDKEFTKYEVKLVEPNGPIVPFSEGERSKIDSYNSKLLFEINNAIIKDGTTLDGDPQLVLERLFKTALTSCQDKSEKTKELVKLCRTLQKGANHKQLLAKVIEFERSMHQQNKMYLLRFTSGVPNHPEMLDSCYDFSKSPPDLRAKNLSFAQSLLAGLVWDGRVEEIFTFDSSEPAGSSSCSFSYFLEFQHTIENSKKENIQYPNKTTALYAIPLSHEQYLMLKDENILRYPRPFSFANSLFGAGERFHPRLDPSDMKTEVKRRKCELLEEFLKKPTILYKYTGNKDLELPAIPITTMESPTHGNPSVNDAQNKVTPEISNDKGTQEAPANHTSNAGK